MNGFAIGTLRAPLRPARAPRRLPHRAADRVRAAVGRRSARGRRGRHLRAGGRPRRRARRGGLGRRARRRNVALFEWLPGNEPDPAGDEVIAGFRTLGAVSARMHGHSRAWTPPQGFDRPAWDYEHTLGAGGHWGAWQDGLRHGRRGAARAGAGLDHRVAARLEAYGHRPTTASASSTPTSASPTCWPTAATSA